MILEIKSIDNSNNIEEGNLLFIPQDKDGNRGIIISGDKEIVNKSNVKLSQVEIKQKPIITNTKIIYPNPIQKIKSSFNINCHSNISFNDYYEMLENIPQNYSKIRYGIKVNIIKEGDVTTDRIGKIIIDSNSYLLLRDAAWFTNPNAKEHYFFVFNPIMITNDEPFWDIDIEEI